VAGDKILNIKKLGILATLIVAVTTAVESPAWAQMDILDAQYEALEQPLSPLEPLPEDVRISARLIYLWTLPDGAKAMVLLGQFRLVMGQRQFSAHDAAIWMEPLRGAGDWTAKRLDVFMQGDGRIVEPGGAVISDEILYSTIRTVGRIEVSARSLARQNASNHPVYLRALALRGRRAATQPEEPIPLEGTVRVHAPQEPPSRAKPERVRFPITLRGNFSIGAEIDGLRPLIGTGGVYLFQAAAEGEEPLELRADNAVVFVKSSAAQAAARTAKATMPATAPAQLTPQQQAELLEKLEQLPTEEERAAPQPPPQVQVARYVSAAYLEGDVVLSRGHRQIRAEQVYYDFDRSTAMIMDMVARTIEPRRKVPIYVRARQARQLSRNQYVAYDAKVTTSEFFTPSYHLGASTVRFEDRTERLETGEPVGLVAGRFEATHATLNLEGVPILYWPYTAGEFKQSETSLRSVRTSYSSDFGVTGKTRWHLMNLLGLEEPEGVDATLNLDYYGRRGPAAGIDLDYERDTYYGLARTYFIYDQGEDRLGGFRGDVVPPHETRGRALLRHRQYLPDKWELTLELSYISDANFLEEFFKSEFDEGKDQETLIYLKKTFGNVVFSTLAQWRLMDFLTQTEHLPEVVVDVLGQPLSDGALVWYSENRVGSVRYRPDQRRIFDSFRVDNTGRTDVTPRADSRQELEVPLELGPLKVVGFGVVRGSWWDSRPFFSGHIGRIMGRYGLRGSLYQWKVFDGVESRFWDLHRLRHVMKEDFTLWMAHSNVDRWELTPFDEGIETIGEIDGASVGWRHRFQTKRGGAGNWRNVDWLTLDFEAGFFNDAMTFDGRNRSRGQTFSYRPENSISSNYVSMRDIWRISDTTALLYDLIVDTDNWAVGASGLGLHIDRDPRLSYFIGHRFIGESDSNLFGFGANYRLNEKYTLAVREEVDLNRGENADFELTLVRRMPRWYLSLTLEFDNVENVDSVSVAVWPEGIPEWTIGSRRYTGLETSTGLRP